VPHINPKVFEGIFQITDKMHTALKDQRGMTVNQLDALLAEACGALSLAIENGIEDVFTTAVDLAQQPGVSADMHTIVRQANAFGSFLQFEREALKACGVSEGTAGYLVDQIEKLKSSLTAFDFTPNDQTARTAMSVIRRSRDDVCVASSQASATITERQKRHWFRVGFIVVSGISVSAANAIAAMATAGAATPFVALSGVAGAAMVTLSGFFQTPPRDRKI
jgi:hypothetical protein